MGFHVKSPDKKNPSALDKSFGKWGCGGEALGGFETGDA
jgi:hypothetical protein